MTARPLRRALLLAAGVAIATAAPAHADVVIVGNHIVQGNLCAGFDCVNDEPFGSDTLRMKENNTRLHFTDTSTAPGAPATDWELTANDSGSGGAAYLGVLDADSLRTGLKAMAGSPTDTLVLEPGGVARLTHGTLVQQVNAIATENATALDSGTLLSSLAGLPIATFHGSGDPSAARHIGPRATAFNTAFGLGTGDDLAAADVAGIALAAAQRLSTVDHQPGPTGAAGPAGPAGERGPAGAPGTPSEPAPTALADFKARLTKLARSQTTVRRRTAGLRKRLEAMAATN